MMGGGDERVPRWTTRRMARGAGALQPPVGAGPGLDATGWQHPGCLQGLKDGG